MKILAIETSTLLGGVALIDDAARLIVEITLNVSSTHSEQLMSVIAHAIEKASLELQDIDVFAVSIGPGSFTGLRIGVSTVKGLSFATGRPIVAVPTLEALAWHFPSCRHPVCAMLDARKKEVFAALFLWDGEGFGRVVPETSVAVERLPEVIGSRSETRGERILFTGEGAGLYRDAILNAFAERAVFPPPIKMIPSPINVAHLGLGKARRGEFSEPISLVPVYGRKSEAELEKDG